MHKGVFIGKHAAEQKKKVLILGESHHVGDYNRDCLGQEAEYTTESVIREDYYRDPYNPKYRIFDKIIKSFGYDPELPGARENFWETVYFGNYIPVLCGIKTGNAAELLENAENRRQYNNHLFEFANEKGIDVIFCFSRLVYKKLPEFSEDAKVRAFEQVDSIKCGKIGKVDDRIDRCRYCADSEHTAVDVLLNKSLTVFGMRHPSSGGGFKPSNYADKLKSELK